MCVCFQGSGVFGAYHFWQWSANRSQEDCCHVGLANSQVHLGLKGFFGLNKLLQEVHQGLWENCSPIDLLTKKRCLGWNEVTNKAFEQLKIAVSHLLVLALPDFTKSFVVECDASGYGIGGVLMQDGKPIAYYSQRLKGKNLFLSIYEKELMPLVLLVKK